MWDVDFGYENNVGCAFTCIDTKVGVPGGPGGAAAVTPTTTSLTVDMPTLFRALTRKQYGRPLSSWARVNTVSGEEGIVAHLHRVANAPLSSISPQKAATADTIAQRRSALFNIYGGGILHCM